MSPESHLQGGRVLSPPTQSGSNLSRGAQFFQAVAPYGSASLGTCSFPRGVNRWLVQSPPLLELRQVPLLLCDVPLSTFVSVGSAICLFR